VNVYYVMAIWVVWRSLLRSSVFVSGLGRPDRDIGGCGARQHTGNKEHVQQRITPRCWRDRIGATDLSCRCRDRPRVVEEALASKPLHGRGVVPLALVGAFCFARYVFDWNFHASEIAGIALSTTSVAVVYAVMWRRVSTDRTSAS